MKNYLSLFFLLSTICSFTQENLEPLKSNFKLLENSLINRTSTINNNDLIYLTDTIDLPIIDDFSTNKFKNYLTDTSLNNISDSNWYKIYFLDGNKVPDTVSYMTSPTFEYVYDSINLNGLDTITVLVNELIPDTLIVKNFSFYPITYDTLILWPNITIVDSLWTQNSPDISYPDLSPDFLQDSLNLFFVHPIAEDFNKIWLDQNVYLNNNYSSNAWTLGIVTFDGLNSAGLPYDWNTGITDWADVLTSKPLFLSQKTVSDSIYFSFFFQSGGNGDTPESDDSLKLEFFIPSINQWYSVWSTNGFESDDWFYKHILLDSNLYFQDGFKFRFSSFGSLNGSLDHWNLDYVYLNENRSQNDTLMQDWAFTSVPISVIDNYSSVPWKHYKLTTSDVFLNNLIIPTYNSSDNPKLLQPCAMDLFYNDFLLSNHPYSATVLNIPPLSYFDMNFNYGNNLNLNIALLDTFVDFDFRYYLSTNTTPERLSENDTIYHKQSFHNYYSYDDGSAEAAYGLVGNGAELAYRYQLLSGIQEDTLKSIKIHFSPSVYDATNDPFFLQIWSDSLGYPGSIIYTSDNFDFPQLYYPEYNSGVNGFYEYELPILVPVTDTFYIGWKQSSSARLNVGFDKNVNTQSNIFYNLGSGFQNTIFSGSLMIRPVFISDIDQVVNLETKINLENDIQLYPNPVNSFFSFYGYNIKSIFIYDLNGREVFKNELIKDHTISVKNWINGVYIVHFLMENGNVIRKKIIIQH